MKYSVIYLEFKSKEEFYDIDYIANESDYDIYHPLIEDSEIFEINNENKSIFVKCFLESEVEENIVDEIIEDLDFSFKNPDNHNEYRMELIQHDLIFQ